MNLVNCVRIGNVLGMVVEHLLMIDDASDKVKWYAWVGERHVLTSYSAIYGLCQVGKRTLLCVQ